jgi:hypothetical protein
VLFEKVDPERDHCGQVGATCGPDWTRRHGPISPREIMLCTSSMLLP